MSTNMGNLEKLGILVIVILVVVVGVVAITPKSTVDERLYPEEVAQVPAEPEPLAPPTDPAQPTDAWPLPPDPTKAGNADPVPPAVGGGMIDGVVTPPVQPAVPTFRTVKVKKGDTLAIIAKRELGSSTRYQEILDINPGVTATKLKINMDLKIPVASAAQGGSSVAVAPPGNGTQPAVPVVTPAPVPAPVAERTYVVKSGDTLSSIASRELGSTKRWPEIAKANEALLHGSTALKVGMSLTLPGSSGGSLSSGDPAPLASPSDGAPSSAGEREYVVKAGDSLWLIAKNEMGSESFIKELRAANADVLKGSDALRLGTKLRIPAKK